MITAKTVYVFDLDGVVTDPRDTSLDHLALGHIQTLLQRGIFVAINTGRSYEWVARRVLSHLEEQAISDTFDHLFIVCEKGGRSIHWHGGEFVPQPSRFALPETVQTICRQVFDTINSQTMFWDESKLTMVTLEKHPQSDFAAFQEEQQTLVAQLNTALASQTVTIDAATSAVDVQSQSAGKHAGAELIYQWAADVGAPLKSFISFGDSPSDFEMARYFAQQGSRSTFVFVGPSTEPFAGDHNVEVIRTKAQFALGTREFFLPG